LGNEKKCLVSDGKGGESGNREKRSGKSQNERHGGDKGEGIGRRRGRKLGHPVKKKLRQRRMGSVRHDDLPNKKTHAEEMGGKNCCEWARMVVCEVIDLVRMCCLG